MLPFAQSVAILPIALFAGAAICRVLGVHKSVLFSFAVALLPAHSLAQAKGLATITWPCAGADLARRSSRCDTPPETGVCRSRRRARVVAQG